MVKLIARATAAAAIAILPRATNGSLCRAGSMPPCIKSARTNPGVKSVTPMPPPAPVMATSSSAIPGRA